ncbi:DUF2020 domain-containing protein [Klenkia sp. PcliD-1-E]|uniref:DUF2020 domain-containing protein n=1 Tax=Klenkia sp. PcliD-1-E TaxID=2954492 RepID=UPI002097D0BE|nr:DUF2020 domain-containing protein [Klenkia sp. PcliD-1-E]MCO7221959.1 DUF2020 domain-containing protein [Klenkia sp. PcliD-1-E]
MVLLLAGCGGSTQDADPAGPSATPPVPSSSSPAPTTTAAPTTAAEPVTTEADCPYLDTAYVEDTVGQRTPTVTTTGVPGGPPPTCTFAKPNGEPALVVEISQAADPVAAQTAAVERVAPLGGTAVRDVGDGGGIAVGPQTVLAVADGSLVVVVTVNQESSLQAREIAQTVVGAV